MTKQYEIQAGSSHDFRQVASDDVPLEIIAAVEAGIGDGVPADGEWRYIDVFRWTVYRWRIIATSTTEPTT